MAVYTDLVKNQRFSRGCYGTIFMNPYASDKLRIISLGIENVTDRSVKHYLNTQSVAAYFNTDVSDWDIVLYGGQFGGFAIEEDGATGIFINNPYGTFDYNSSLDIDSMLSNGDMVYFFKPTFRSASVLDGTGTSCENRSVAYVEKPLVGACPKGHGLTTSTDDSNAIQGVYILENEVVKNKAYYGYHSNVYNSYNTYKLKLLLPYSLSIVKLEQMIESEALALYMDNIDVYDYTKQSGYNINKPLGGGSVNPLIRKITIVSGSMKESVRRSGYEIEVLLEG